MGFEDEAEQSLGRPCRYTNGRSKRTYELTSSIVPRRTSFHGLVELEYSPIVIDPAWLLCRRDLPGPTELSAINPYAVQRVFEGFTFVRLSNAHLPKVLLGLFLQRCRVGLGDFTPSLSQIPDLRLSPHPARATTRRLSPSVENWSSSCCQLARSQRR